MGRQQHDTLVARAIVEHEIGCLRNGGGAVPQDGSTPSLTAARIVDAYGLRWGRFATHAHRAEQLVRKALNVAWYRGALNYDGRDGRWVRYVKGRQP